MNQEKIESFIKRYENESMQNEKSFTQKFWTDLLQDVLGAIDANRIITFEDPVYLKNKSYVDAYIAETSVLIEQKSGNIDLNKKAKQSDGEFLTPYEQAKRYNSESKYTKRARFIVVSNFRDIVVYNMENDRPEKNALTVHIKDLYQEKTRDLLDFLIDKSKESIRKEEDISLSAGDLVQKLYLAFAQEYINPKTSTHYLDSDDFKQNASCVQHQSINILCVRLVFCLYAQKAGLFSSRNAFCDFLKSFANPENARQGLLELFLVLNTKEEERDPYNTTLNSFPYVNGGLFCDKEGFRLEVPSFSKSLLYVLINDCGNFDWSQISPAIFGAVFESTLNPLNRRAGGMHYTSIENIHKAIDPLFLNDLKEELITIKQQKEAKKKRELARAFQEKLSSLTFLDPACGSGNFLTETYISLRKLENETLKIILQDSLEFEAEGFSSIKVNIGQFFGLEINDFAVTVAKTALYIAQSQMLKETCNIIENTAQFLPLKDLSGITECNALLTNWQTLEGANLIQPLGSLFDQTCGIVKRHYDYIMGNPPFVGARIMSKIQKEELFSIFENDTKQIGNLDYVTAWYKKAASLIQGTSTRCAFVSTNSITQGEQVSPLWKTLIKMGVHIDFAYKTFKWEHERKTGMAHVHCVIIGFSACPNTKPRIIFEGKKQTLAQNINGYLMAAPNIFIENRSAPLCPSPILSMGNKPIDNGNYLFSYEEMQAFLKKEPRARSYFHPWFGAQEFLNGTKRYCLYLGNCPVSELSCMKECLKRVQAVRDFRLESKRKSTIKIAQMPTRFFIENFPTSNYLLIPAVSSGKRQYIPIGFMEKNDITSNAAFLLPESTLYHFGILTSSVHNVWISFVCGRLKSDYRYSVGVVYNNFPWPKALKTEQKIAIEQKAKAILDTRKAIFEADKAATFSALYSPLTMPASLQKAHKELDREVLKAYSLSPLLTQEEITQALIVQYEALVKNSP